MKPFKEGSPCQDCPDKCEDNLCGKCLSLLSLSFPYFEIELLFNSANYKIIKKNICETAMYSTLSSLYNHHTKGPN